MTEEWRVVVGWDDYEVSSLGRVRSWKNNRHGRSAQPRILNPALHPLGYARVGLSMGHAKRITKVHVLVAEAFYGSRPDGLEVRHLNGDPWDNRLENLRYGTPKENAKDQDLHGTRTRGTRQGSNKLSEDDVRELRRLRNEGWPMSLLAKHFGICIANVHAIVHGRTWGWLK